MDKLALVPVITIIINIIKPFISNKSLLPVIAVILGGLSGLLMDGDIVVNILEGITIGAGAVGVHELTKVGTSAKKEQVDLPDNYREDV